MRLIVRVLFTMTAGIVTFAVARIGLDRAAQWAGLVAVVVAVAAWLLPVGRAPRPHGATSADTQEITGVATTAGISQTSRQGRRRRSQLIRWSRARGDVVQSDDR